MNSIVFADVFIQLENLVVVLSDQLLESLHHFFGEKLGLVFVPFALVRHGIIIACK